MPALAFIHYKGRRSLTFLWRKEKLQKKTWTEITSRDLRPPALVLERRATIYIYGFVVLGVRRAFDEDLGLHGLWLDL